MSWLYQPLLPGGAQLQSSVAYTDAVTAGVIDVAGQNVTLTYAPLQQPVSGGASYLTQEEYEAALARYRKLENARKDIKRRERDKWNRIMGRAVAEEAAPEPPGSPQTAKTPNPLVIAPIPTVQPPSAKLEAIAAEMQRLRDKIAAHEKAQAEEEDEIETLLMLVA